MNVLAQNEFSKPDFFFWLRLWITGFDYSYCIDMGADREEIQASAPPFGFQEIKFEEINSK
jgi:hypothetical protein